MVKCRKFYQSGRHKNFTVALQTFNFNLNLMKPTDKNKDKGEEAFPGYPHYPQSEDIFNKDKEETELDPENPNTLKTPPEEEPEVPEELNFEEPHTGADLDVPGAELDDTQEDVGSEDEENNYYSLGSDDNDHEDRNLSWTITWLTFICPGNRSTAY